LKTLAPGTLVGKYPVVRVMSTGGMGVIYEAAHPVLGTRVVIKTVLPSMAGNAALADRFRNEAMAASRIRDDRLPQIFDIDKLEDNTQYMVMEFLEGEDLQQRLAQGPLSVGYSVRVVFEVLEVLHKVHQLGIVHRDITPRNIFLARSDLFGEIPKLLDFGVAHFANDSNTRPGEVVGSPFYMAPEQVHARSSIGPWTDVFAAGVVLYEMLSGAGVRPWPTTNLVTYLTALATRHPPRDLAEVMPSLPPGLSSAVMKAIKFEATDRFRDAASFAQAIEPFAAPRAMLYEARSQRPRSNAPRPGEAEKTALENDATIAATASRKSVDLKPAAAARMLAGIQSQLAGLVRRAEAPGAARARLRQGERRHMTVLLLSVLLEEPRERALDAEDQDQLYEQIVSLFERQLDVFGGHVMPPLGGSLMATFGYERANEDDAERAVSAAAAMLEQRHEINATLTEIGYVVNLRIGVHSGFVTRGREGGRDEIVTGMTVNAAKLLERSAPLNSVLVSRENLDLLGGRFSDRPFGKLVLKGRPDPLEAFEIIGPAEEEVQRWSRGGACSSGGFIGREDELAILSGVYEQACLSAAAIGAIEGLSAQTLVNASDAGGPSSAEQSLGGARSLRGTEAAPPSGAKPPPVRVGLVTGGPGLGKSRLLHELLARIDADDQRRTLVLRAEAASSAPYGVWVAFLQRLFLAPGGTRFDAAQVSDQLAQIALGLDEPKRSELLSQAPVVAFLLGLGGHDLADDHTPAELQGRIQQTLALTLEAMARRSAVAFKGRPAIVVLDGLHRADAASLHMLGRVLGAVRATVPPVFFVATRDPELERLAEGASVTKCTLEPLCDAEVTAIAAGIAGHPLSPDAERLVVERAAGNPLFVEELVLALRDQEITGADAAGLRTFVPTSLFGLILSRIDRLGPELGSALKYASVLGPEFPTRIFEAVVSAVDDERVSRKQLIELERRGILSSRFEQRDEVFAFRQVIVQGAVYSTILRENKRVLHKLAAEATERLYAGRLDAHVAPLFQHYSQTDEVERIVHYARTGGSRAVALGAFHDSIEMLLMAETLRPRLQNDDPQQAAKAVFDLGTALFWMGRVRDAGERAEQADAMLASDDRPKSLTLRARACLLLAEAEYQQARFADSAARLTSAEELFRRADRPFDAAQAQCTLGFQLRAQGRIEEGLALAKKGWETLKDSENLPAVVRAGHDLGNILRDSGDLLASLEVFERAIAAGEELRRSGNSAAALWGQLAARSGRAMTYAAMGRLDEAIADQRAVYALSVQENNPLGQVSAGFHLANHLVEKGDLGAAEHAALRSLKLCGTLGLPAREMKCRMLLAQIEERRGRKAEVIRHLEAAEALARHSQVSDDAWLDVAEQLLAALRSQNGSSERAEALIGEARARAERSKSPGFRTRVLGLGARGG
jgi:serine/threonine-protein kinase